MSVTEITVNTDLYFTGVLHVSADGTQGTGRRFSNYKVHVTKILNYKAKYPILLGDKNSNQLGWVSEDDLTGVRTARITTVPVNQSKYDK